MSAVTEYAFLNARVSAMAGRLLSPRELQALVSGDEAAAEAYMRVARLPPQSRDWPRNPREMEQLLASRLLHEAAQLMRILRGPARELLHHWMRRFEIINIKIVLRCKVTGCSPDHIRPELLDVAPLDTLSIDALLHAEDVAEVLRLLESSHYDELARQARAAYEERKDLFALESALDRYYFARLAQRAAALEAMDRTLVQPLVGEMIDQTNLVWLLRFRFSYGMAPGHAYYLLIHGGRRLDGVRLQALARQESVAGVLERLPEPLRGQVSGAMTTAEVEERVAVGVLRRARHLLTRTSFNLARAFAYLLLRERQLLDLHQVAKGRHLQLSPELIRSALSDWEAA